MELIIEHVSHFSKALDCIKDNKVVAATKLFIKVVEDSKENVDKKFISYLNLGNICKQDKQIDKAIHYWILAYSVLPTRSESIYEITKYYREHSKHHLAYSYYILGKKNLLPTKNSLKVNKEVYNFLLDYELSILSHYLNLPIDNGKLLNDLLNKCHNRNMRVSLISNYKFYAFKLSTITDREIDLCKHVLSKADHNKNYKATSPSISLQDGLFLVNVRFVNYKITPNGSYTNHNGSHISIIKTNNAVIIFDKDFTRIEDKVFLSKHYDNLYIRGIEDVKIFSTSTKTYFMGVVQQQQKTIKDTYVIGMVFGEYDIEKDILEYTELKSPFNKNCEKNWALFEHKGEIKFIYGWNPLTIGRIVDNKSEIIQQITEVPFMFQELRGSTNGFRYNNEIWFVCHSVEYSTPRHYYHCFIVLDYDTLSVVKYSKWFTFDGDKIEFCLGVIIEDDRVILSHSNWDGSSKLKFISKNKVDELFV